LGLLEHRRFFRTTFPYDFTPMNLEEIKRGEKK
jgi:hypothetical protein